MAVTSRTTASPHSDPASRTVGARRHGYRTLPQSASGHRQCPNRTSYRARWRSAPTPRTLSAAWGCWTASSRGPSRSLRTSSPGATVLPGLDPASQASGSGLSAETTLVLARSLLDLAASTSHAESCALRPLCNDTSGSRKPKPRHTVVQVLAEKLTRPNLPGKAVAATVSEQGCRFPLPRGWRLLRPGGSNLDFLLLTRPDGVSSSEDSQQLRQHDTGQSSIHWVRRPSRCRRRSSAAIAAGELVHGDGGSGWPRTLRLTLSAPASSVTVTSRQLGWPGRRVEAPSRDPETLLPLGGRGGAAHSHSNLHGDLPLRGTQSPRNRSTQHSRHPRRLPGPQSLLSGEDGQGSCTAPVCYRAASPRSVSPRLPRPPVARTPPDQA